MRKLKLSYYLGTLMQPKNYQSFFMLIVFSLSIAAQQPPDESRQTSTNVSSNPTDANSENQLNDNRYRIGPGDLLEIRVFDRPQYSRDSVRVGGRGTIMMPRISEEIQAACRTESELAQEISTHYLKFLKNPQVDVFIKEYNSQPVALIGAVNAPSRFQLQRQVRLLELLAFVGGPAPRAGNEVQIIHSDTAFSCPNSVAADNATSSLVPTVDIYNLSETLRGEDKANPYIRPGDVVKIPDAPQAFIVGNVMRPSVITLNERVTLTRAIAISGGTLPDTKSDKIRILRESSNGKEKSELIVDLKAIRSQKTEDIVLQAGDIVEVPTKSGFVRALKGLVNSIIPTATTLPITIIR